MSFARVFEIFAGVLLRGGLDDLRRGLKDLRGSLEIVSARVSKI